MTEDKVRKRVRMFKNGGENVHDEPHSGRLSVITDDLVSAVNHKLHEDRRFMITTLSMEFPQVSWSALYEYTIVSFGWDVLDHPPYSPDLASSDFHLFHNLIEHLGGKRFGSDEEVKTVVNTWFSELVAELFEEGIQNLVVRFDKCLNKHGNYVDK